MLADFADSADGGKGKSVGGIVLSVASLGVTGSTASLVEESASRLESLELRDFRYGFIWDF